MKRSIHRFPFAALALIALFFTSAVTQCPIRGLAVEVPDLEANQIQGLQLWRTDEETGQTYEQNCRIVFGETTLLPDGKEMMEYTLLSPEGDPLLESNYAAIDRREGENGPVRLYFLFGSWRETPGWFRVTSYNAVGESEISAEAVFL